MSKIKGENIKTFFISYANYYWILFTTITYIYNACSKRENEPFFFFLDINEQ